MPWKRSALANKYAKVGPIQKMYQMVTMTDMCDALDMIPVVVKGNKFSTIK